MVGALALRLPDGASNLVSMSKPSKCSPRFNLGTRTLKLPKSEVKILILLFTVKHLEEYACLTKLYGIRETLTSRNEYKLL